MKCLSAAVSSCKFSHFQRHNCFSKVSQGRSSAALLDHIKGGEKIRDASPMSLLPPKGTRDFYPEDFRQRDWLFNKWKDAAALFGFEEYDAPVVEHEALYLRKAGDDISQQLYSFEDKGGRRLSLRPEMTPSLARMVLAHRGTLSLPLKWFSIPQCWRYERMSRGRRREHYQWNMDIWGVSSVDAEGELLSAAVLSLKQMGLTSADVGIKVNSRLLLQNLFSLSGVKEDRFISTCLVVDRMGKLSESDFMAQLVEAANISVDQAKNLLILLNEKDVTQLPEMTSDIRDLFNYCASAGILDWVEFDASIVRGLSYYSGIVFEGFDRSGQLRALFGGGRYDNVLTTLGSTSSIPAVGFGFGDAVIMELLEAKGLLPSLAQSRTVQIVVVALSGEVSSNAITCAAALRDAQFSTELLLHDNKFKRTLQKANRLGADSMIVFARSPAGENTIFHKCMKTGIQKIIPEGEVVQHLLGSKIKEDVKA